MFNPGRHLGTKPGGSLRLRCARGAQSTASEGVVNEAEDLQRVRADGAAFGAEIVARLMAELQRAGSPRDDESASQEDFAVIGLRGCHAIADTAEGKWLEGLIAAAAFAVILHGDAGPVEHRLAQLDLGGIAHDDETSLAATLGHRGHAREGPKGRVVSTRERPGSLGEQGGERDRADPGQRTKDGRVARSAALGSGVGFAQGCQGCAELIELARNLMELLVGQAQPGDEGTKVENGGLGDTRRHRDRRLTEDAQRRLCIELANAVLPEQPRQRRLAQARRLGRGWRQRPQRQDPLGCHVIAQFEKLRVVTLELLADTVAQAHALVLELLG